MSRGAILFAFNSPKYDYYAMAEFTAQRINHFLNMPVTLVTNEKSLASSTGYKFDKVIVTEADPTNNFRNVIWINKGRYMAYELSPYDETLVLDADYMVNSNKLSKIFDCMDDFTCHDSTAYFMHGKTPEESLGPLSFNTLWATVIGFKKTKRVKQIFECLEMVQKNYAHYANIHGFPPEIYRNDYGLTLAHRIVNGHSYPKSDIIPWNLMHVGIKTYVYKNSPYEFNTSYTILFDKWNRGKLKKEYITIKDMDFHVINKDIFVELIQ